MGEMISFPSNGKSASGYLARPEAGRGPGVVVIQEWWGLVGHITSICDRLAAEGFTALAVDLYHGEHAWKEPDEAQKKMMALDVHRAGRDLGGAVDWLLASDSVAGDAVGVVGFCMGGGLALYLATLREQVAAAVVFYGVAPWPDAQPDPARIRGSVLAHWGGADHSNTREQVATLEGELRRAGVAVTSHWYEGADHAFFNDERPEVYDAEAAALSWRRTLEFLRQALSGAVAGR